MTARERDYFLQHKARYHHRKAEVILPPLIRAALDRSPKRLVERLVKRRQDERAAVVTVCACLARFYRDHYQRTAD